jgi:hypothetical protein
VPQAERGNAFHDGSAAAAVVLTVSSDWRVSDSSCSPAERPILVGVVHYCQLETWQRKVAPSALGKMNGLLSPKACSGAGTPTCTFTSIHNASRTLGRAWASNVQCMSGQKIVKPDLLSEQWSARPIASRTSHQIRRAHTRMR